MDRLKIEATATNLLKQMWAARAELCPILASPLEILDPAIAAKFLGIDYQEPLSLGSFIYKGKEMEVAGRMDRDSGVIAVSQNFGSEVARFTGAHEIGHWLLHPRESMHRDRPVDGHLLEQRPQMEKDADYFAACLLMPRKTLIKEVNLSFGHSPVIFDSDLAFWLRLQDVTEIIAANEGSDERELAIASATAFKDQHFNSLATRFRVSNKAMAFRLKEFQLVRRIEVQKSQLRSARSGSGAPLIKALTSKARNESALLPITSIGLKSAPRLNNVRLVLLQHALRDSKIFISEAIRAGVIIGAFVAKPNSLSEEIVADIERMGVQIIREPKDSEIPYEYFEKSEELPNLIAAQASIAKNEGRKLVLVDVGGYFCKPLIASPPDVIESIAGVVEVTTFGYTRYIENANKVKVPILSIARSELKRAEAISVGDSVVRATEDLLQEAGHALAGKCSGVIGYGMIGQEIAKALQRRNIRTSVYDRSPIRLLQARLDGFEIGTLAEVLPSADLVFASTGTQSIGLKDLKFAKSGVTLLSGGSRAQEFALPDIQAAAKSSSAITNLLQEYKFDKGQTCVVANAGKAINFLKDGTPEEIMDLVFAEITECIRHLVFANVPIGLVSELPMALRESIAARWLNLSKRPSLYASAKSVETDSGEIQFGNVITSDESVSIASVLNPNGRPPNPQAGKSVGI